MQGECSFRPSSVPHAVHHATKSASEGGVRARMMREDFDSFHPHRAASSRPLSPASCIRSRRRPATISRAACALDEGLAGMQGAYQTA